MCQAGGDVESALSLSLTHTHIHTTQRQQHAWSFKPPRFKGDTHRSIILVSRGVTNETHTYIQTHASCLHPISHLDPRQQALCDLLPAAHVHLGVDQGLDLLKPYLAGRSPQLREAEEVDDLTRVWGFGEGRGVWGSGGERRRRRIVRGEGVWGSGRREEAAGDGGRGYMARQTLPLKP